MIIKSYPGTNSLKVGYLTLKLFVINALMSKYAHQQNTCRFVQILLSMWISNVSFIAKVSSYNYLINISNGKLCLHYSMMGINTTKTKTSRVFVDSDISFNLIHHVSNRHIAQNKPIERTIYSCIMLLD